MEYKDLEINDIINWCKEHNQIEWLKATAAKKVARKVYPRKTVIKIVNGVETTHHVADKSQEPTIVERPISFVELKSAFRDKFLKDEMPKKPKKPTMYDIIANL